MTEIFPDKRKRMLNTDTYKGRFPLRKISIGSDRTLFHLVLSAPPDQKSRKYLNSLSWDHRFKLEQKIGTKSPCAVLILFRSGPMPCLFS